MLRVVLYGKFVDLAGEPDFALKLPQAEMSVEEVVSLIAETRGDLAVELGKKSTRIVVNDVLDVTGPRLTDGDEIAFLPPVSGG
ncbi:MoaD/ThiS family protein [Parvularcula marina]|uniref:MoaD/ThiS family protein n=1 Tax=Parvularcula marina TaxID=2292771 RepID=UPI0035136D4E